MQNLFSLLKCLRERIVGKKLFSKQQWNFYTFCMELLLISSLFYSFFFQSKTAQFLAVFLVFVYLLSEIYKNRKVGKNYFIVFLLFFSILLPALLKFEFVATYAYFVIELILFLGCYFLISSPERYLLILKIVFYSFVTIIFYFRIKYHGYDEPLSFVVEGSSQNGIPSYLIVLLATYSFCCLVVKNTIPILPAILTLVVAFWGEGRGSMIVSMALLLLAILWFAMEGRNRNVIGKLVFYTGFSVVLAVVILNFSLIIGFLVSGTKLSVGLLDVHRINILDSYLGSLNPLSLIIGKDYSGTIIEELYNGNPHVAFIRLHAFFGLFPLIVILVSPLLIFSGGFSIKVVFLSTLLFCFLLRAATEPVLFPTLLDFFYFSCFFVFYRFNGSRGYQALTYGK